MAKYKRKPRLDIDRDEKEANKNNKKRERELYLDSVISEEIFLKYRFVVVVVVLA